MSYMQKSCKLIMLRTFRQLYSSAVAFLLYVHSYGAKCLFPWSLMPRQSSPLFSVRFSQKLPDKSNSFGQIDSSFCR